MRSGLFKMNIGYSQLIKELRIKEGSDCLKTYSYRTKFTPVCQEELKIAPPFLIFCLLAYKSHYESVLNFTMQRFKDLIHFIMPLLFRTLINL